MKVFEMVNGLKSGYFEKYVVKIFDQPILKTMPLRLRLVGLLGEVCENSNFALHFLNCLVFHINKKIYFRYFLDFCRTVHGIVCSE